MDAPFGFELLTEQLMARVASDADSTREDAVGDSEIEKLFYVALKMFVHTGQCEYKEIYEPRTPQARAQAFESTLGRLSLVLDAQVQLEGWRVDFLIHAYDWGTRPGRKEGWRKLIVECDGHDFHERTKEQAAKDRSRDRQAQAQNYTIFRFTGSELWRDPIKCVQQVIDWAIEGWP